MSRNPASSRSSVSVSQVLVHLLPGALLFALFAAVGILHVSSRVLVVDAGYRLSQAEARQRALTRENDQLKLELATLKSPARLERLAREQLGMSMPSGPLVISLPARRAPTSRRAQPPNTTPVRVSNPGGAR